MSSDSLKQGFGPLTDRWFSVWHGTDYRSAVRIERDGIIPTQSRPALDFGTGFYTTSKRKQAEHWANTRAERTDAETAALVQFTVFYADLAKLSRVSFIRFDRSATEFWTFVQRMRSGLFHSHSDGRYFDLICGPLSKRPGRCRAIPDSDQFSFHSRQGYSFINSCKKLLVTPNTGGRFQP